MSPRYWIRTTVSPVHRLQSRQYIDGDIDKQCRQERDLDKQSRQYTAGDIDKQCHYIDGDNCRQLSTLSTGPRKGQTPEYWCCHSSTRSPVSTGSTHWFSWTFFWWRHGQTLSTWTDIVDMEGHCRQDIVNKTLDQQDIGTTTSDTQTHDCALSKISTMGRDLSIRHALTALRFRKFESFTGSSCPTWYQTARELKISYRHKYSGPESFRAPDLSRNQD